MESLSGALRGRLVLPSDGDYDRSRRVAYRRFQARPAAVAWCEGEEDVRSCLDFVRRHRLPLALRSGGHSTAGASVGEGLVLDTSRMDHVVVEGRRARVGPGASAGRVGGLHVPVGSCDDVRMAGFMQGGGYGLTSRRFGLNCDSVVEVTVMLADGRVVRASREEHPDLFWAVRGGGGGQFGVLLEVEYETHDLGEVWAFSLAWDLERAPRVLASLEREFSPSPRLGYVALLCRQAGEPRLMVRGLFQGTAAGGRREVSRLRAMHPLEGDLSWEGVGSFGELNERIHHWPRRIPECPEDAALDKQSLYLDRPLAQEVWEEILDLYLGSPDPDALLLLEPYGGAIAAVPRAATAFPHREVCQDLVVAVSWTDAAGEAASRAWLDRLMAFLEPHGNGHSYPNYPRPGLPDPGWRYWGEHCERLRALQDRYDPEGLFRPPQGLRS